MTRNTTEFVFDEEIERLEQEREDLVEDMADMEQDNPAFAQLATRQETINKHLNGLYWARDEALTDDSVTAWDTDADSVVLGGLNSAEWGVLRKQLQQDGDETPDNVYDVVAGTEGAPYWDDEASEAEQFAAVGSLPPAFTQWASAKISDLTEVGEGNETHWSELLAERRATQTEK